jgi:anti-sigma factor RsiW
MSAHLGRALSAFVDGELDHARREEVQVHLAHCAECRGELAALRLIKGALRGDLAASAPDDLAARVLAATAAPGQPALVPRAHATRRRARPEHGAVRRTAMGAGAVALGVGAAFALAGPPPSAPVAPVDPTSSGLVISHVSTANEVPFAGPGVVPVSAPVPGR